jgi:outer membrane biosynthesis protein TonB
MASIATLLTLSVLVWPSPTTGVLIHLVHRKEAHSTTTHTKVKKRVMSFTPMSQLAKASLSRDDELTTTHKKVLFAKYMVKWQQAVVKSANLYLAHHTMEAGTIVVDVEVLPDGGLASYRVVSSTNRFINPAITAILIKATPYPKPPEALVRSGPIVIERTWTFS